MTIAVGQSIVSKQGSMSVGTQMPIQAPPTMEASYTQDPVDVAESDPSRKVLTHRHFGHPEEHPVTLRHRKASVDPMHGEEDKVIDEYKDLYDKARRGECNPVEMKRVHQLRGRLQEIQASRESDARRILGGDLLEAAASPGGGFSLKPPAPMQQPAPPKVTGGNLLTQTASGRSGKTFKAYPIRKAVDSAIMATDSIMKSHHGELHYPADRPENYGVHGSMPHPASGDVAHDVQHATATGPYSRDVTGGRISEKAGQDGRRYLHPGEEPPPGTSVQQGPRGGQFIESEPSQSLGNAPADQPGHPTASSPDGIPEGYDSEMEYWGDVGVSELLQQPDMEDFVRITESDWNTYLTDGEMDWDSPEDVLDRNVKELKREFSQRHPNIQVEELDENFKGAIQELWEGFQDRNSNEWPGPWDEDSIGSRGRMDRAMVSVPSSANTHKGFAFAQRPLK